MERPKGLVARTTYLVTRRRYKTVTDPVKALAHTPFLLAGYGALEMSAERSHHADERLKDLAMVRAGSLVGCEWCMDFGSAKMLASGIPEEDLRALPNYATSDRFTELERLVLDYTTAMSRTPLEMPDELVARLREHLSDAAIVEITMMIALEHLRARFNWALGIGAQGFAEGGFCVVPAPLDAAA
jgi:4-carboxymuconolactone decarboxylase